MKLRVDGMKGRSGGVPLPSLFVLCEKLFVSFSVYFVDKSARRRRPAGGRAARRERAATIGTIGGRNRPREMVEDNTLHRIEGAI